MRDTMDAPLHEHLSALDASLTALSEGGRLEADDPVSKDVISDKMSHILTLPEGAAALVQRYGGDMRAAVVRPLAFLLAIAVNDRDRAHALAATVFAMVDELQTDDPWPRLNLCTAVQRLLMFGAFTPSPETPETLVSSAMSRLLRESLEGPPALRSTAATVVADLFYRQRTAAIPAADLSVLRAKLLSLTDDSDELTRKEAEGLREFLAEAPSGQT